METKKRKCKSRKRPPLHRVMVMAARRLLQRIDECHAAGQTHEESAAIHEFVTICTMLTGGGMKPSHSLEVGCDLVAMLAPSVDQAIRGAVAAFCMQRAPSLLSRCAASEATRALGYGEGGVVPIELAAVAPPAASAAGIKPEADATP